MIKMEVWLKMGNGSRLVKVEHFENYDAAKDCADELASTVEDTTVRLYECDDPQSQKGELLYEAKREVNDAV